MLKATKLVSIFLFFLVIAVRIYVQSQKEAGVLHSTAKNAQRPSPQPKQSADDTTFALLVIRP